MGVAATLPELSEWTLKFVQRKLDIVGKFNNYLGKFIVSHL